MMGYDQDAYAAALARSAQQTRRAYVLAFGPPLPTPTGMGIKGPQNTQLVERIADTIKAEPLTSAEVKAKVQPQLEKPLSDHMLRKYLVRLCQEGRIQKAGMRSEGTARFALYVRAPGQV